jgi:hypothetical protein
VRSLAAALALAFVACAALAGEPKLVSEPRRLGLADVGKVFVKVDQEPHPNFGHYLILTSVDALYGFDTFNLDKGKPIGKLYVSYFGSPNFREAFFDQVAMTAVWSAIDTAAAKNDREMAEWRKTLPGGDASAAPPKPASRPIELGEADPYARMIRRPNPQGLVLQYNPALVAELLLGERRAGRPLNQTEVERIRDERLVGAVLPAAMRTLRDERGYDDVDPAKVWEQWQKVRVGLVK